MTNFTERAVPTITANFLMKEALARYVFASKYISPNELVIDLASGTGYGATLLAKKASAYVGVDINDEALLYSQKKYSSAKISFLKMDVNNLLFKEKSFKVAVAFEMIEHLKRTEVFLKEVVRILDRKGVFIVSTPNRLIQSPSGTLMSPYHTKEFSPDEFVKLLQKHFKEVTVFGQRKNNKAIASVERFMFSQEVRQFLVDCDIFNIRKLFDQDTKEYIWKYLGNFVGRADQEVVNTSDFKISRKNLNTAEYLIAVCKK